MNKQELVKFMAEKGSVTAIQAEKLLEAFIEGVSKTLSKKGEVKLVGFGTFATQNKAARTGRNPRTGEQIKIAASVQPKFRPGKELKEVVNR